VRKIKAEEAHQTGYFTGLYMSLHI